MNGRLRGVAWFSVALGFASSFGCAASDRMLAGRRDYTTYRAFRLATTPLERLRYGNRYLKDVPEGRFRTEVSAWFERAEPRFYRTAYDRPSLLRAYLSAMPDGPNAEPVIDRLVELEALREYRARQAAREEAAIERARIALEQAQAQRESLVRELTVLIRLLADVRTFGKPVQALERDFSDWLHLQEPSARCEKDACVKTVLAPYAVPEAKQLAPREAAYQVELLFRRGLLAGVTLRGPELFSRLYEASSRQPVPAGDFAARLEALARVSAMFETLLEARFPAQRCARDVIAPLLLRRECDGTVVELRAGTEPGQDDGLSIAPARTGRPPVKR